MVGNIKAGNGPKVDVFTEGCEVEYLVDTGSPVNVIDELTFKRIMAVT